MTANYVRHIKTTANRIYSAFKRTRSHATISGGLAVISALTLVLSIPLSAAALETDANQRLAPVVQVLNASSKVTYVDDTHVVPVPYETVYIEDDGLLIGETMVITAGSNGVRRIVERVGYIAGVEISRSAVQSNVIVEVVDEVVAIGTSTKPTTASYGVYFWPAEGEVTSGFGRRNVSVGSRNHQGIDLTGDKGDPIYAADGGVVITANSKMRGYGRLIIIQHDNGDLTYYAHNTRLLVEEGDIVYRGQQIAEMGSTGTSSGVHCHFELRIDGTPVNPIDYLPQREIAE